MWLANDNESTGSTEDKSRVVIVNTERPPAELLRQISALGGWRPLGKGIGRGSDGLCVVANSASEYPAPPGSPKDAVAAARNHPQSVVLSLLYC